ncbi:MAG: ComF family protein [Solirubrobacterales bacterium]
MLPEAARSLTALVAPPRCGICGAGCDPRKSACPGCASELARARPLSGPGPAGIDLVVAAGAHEGTVRALATALKFGGRLPLARRAAALIRAAAAPEILRGGLVPVPPDPVRFRVRGFDPAEEIAASLALITGLRLERCLARSAGRRQVGRPRRERLGSPPKVSAWRTPPRAVVLVDDVWTTGATLAACAAALRGAGADRVVAVTLAHAV